MLILQKIIGEGMVRTCYFHPHDDRKCVKVVKNSKDIKSLQRELQTYEKVKNRLSPFICHHDQQLIETDKGPGLVAELIRDDNGEIAPKLSAFLKQQSINAAIKKQFDDFFRKLLDNRLYSGKRRNEDKIYRSEKLSVNQICYQTGSLAALSLAAQNYPSYEPVI